MSSGVKPADQTKNESTSTQSLTTQAATGHDAIRMLDSSASPAQPLKRASTTPLPSTSSSAPTSPNPSRDTSPIRPPLKPGIVSTSRPSRSRKNSQELSPHRAPATAGINLPTVPSAAAIQRALSVTGTPQLQSPATPDFSIEPPKTQRSSKPSNVSAARLGPTPPRLKSPPPSASSIRPLVHSPRKLESLPPPTPSIVVERATPNSISSREAELEDDENLMVSGLRSPGRSTSGNSTLETVQESSIPISPAIGAGVAQLDVKTGESNRPSTIEETPAEEGMIDKMAVESGSESGGTKGGGNKRANGSGRKSVGNVVKTPNLAPRKSYSQLNPAKIKVGEGFVKNMTVETETVSSVPQVAVGGGAGERGLPGRIETGGSLRLKPSSETIRPRKDKKKTMRKAPSINSGTASSKADIFEAKVASAVDEANSSDSAETFVYESNPPEPLSARPSRYHSRTPSATSTASQADHYGGRHRQEGHHSIAGKKSMKFANNSHLINSHGDSGEKPTGTAAGNSGRLTGGNSSHHHHVGRHNRSAAGHTSLFDNESPFPNAAKPLRASISGAARMSPRVASPRSPHFFRVSGTAVKSNSALIYDLEGEGTDDEQTPLINSIRSGRTRVGRRPGYRRIGYDGETASGYCRRVTGCILFGGVVGLLIAAVVVALIMSSKPLIDVHIKEIQNVLASEEEIMLDLHVHAINPNLVAIQVSDLDVNIFAKSKYIGTKASRRNHLLPTTEEYKGHHISTADSSTNTEIDHSTIEAKSLRISDGVDEGNDPIEDPEGDSQTMLLGQIFDFDSPLIFDPSPVRHQSLSSIGEVRLARPGNMTEEGGSDRWEKVLQHPFELIVRGVLRYSLPISSRRRSASIGGSVTVHPEAGVNSPLAGASQSKSIKFLA